MTSKSDKPSLSTVDLSTSTIAMTIPDNFIKNLELLKDHLNLMKMINGLQLKITNGYPKKMHK